MTDEYNKIAGFYNFFFSYALSQLRKDIRTFIYHKKYTRIVDLCCGTGEQLIMLDRPGMELCGIDNSLAMLEVARRDCPEYISLHLLDAEQVSFAENSYDCAVISLGLHDKHLTSAASIFDNACRLVRENGSVIVADYAVSPLKINGIIFSRFIIPLIERCAGKNHFHNYQNWIRQSGIESFIESRSGSSEIISRSLGGALMCCSVTKSVYKKTKQQAHQVAEGGHPPGGACFARGAFLDIVAHGLPATRPCCFQRQTCPALWARGKF